jgi:ribose transport system substrate-binding protein
VTYVMSPGHWLAGYIATRALANAKASGTPLIQGLLLVPGELVGAENVEAVIARQQSAETVAAALAPVGDAVLADPAAHIVGPWPPQ